MNSNKYMSSPRQLMRLITILILISINHSVLAKNGINADSKSGLAIQGYDAVAYFKQSQPQRGDEAFSHEYKGVTWRFANQHNLQSFIDTPEDYIPQYGGFCAFAASRNAIASVDPKAWTIDEGKLYLNYSLGVRNKWRGDQKSNIKKADGFWPELVKKVQ